LFIKKEFTSRREVKTSSANFGFQNITHSACGVGAGSKERRGGGGHGGRAWYRYSI